MAALASAAFEQGQRTSSSAENLCALCKQKDTEAHSFPWHEWLRKRDRFFPLPRFDHILPTIDSVSYPDTPARASAERRMPRRRWQPTKQPRRWLGFVSFHSCLCCHFGSIFIRALLAAFRTLLSPSCRVANRAGMDALAAGPTSPKVCADTSRMSRLT